MWPGCEAFQHHFCHRGRRRRRGRMGSDLYEGLQNTGVGALSGMQREPDYSCAMGEAAYIGLRQRPTGSRRRGVIVNAASIAPVTGSQFGTSFLFSKYVEQFLTRSQPT
eukprot:scaffold3372_cov248-Prasinococcus_capsulatus_cf.AAC.1